ncbi:MAG: murein biosynthesis integral membrane protein MurJ [Kofleriaceae bacterium]
MPPPSSRRTSGAIAVGIGIFLSRVAGFARERALAHYLGNSPAAGALRAAMRIPNVLQNLLGEGVLSASFIPVYTRLLEQGREEEAHRAARAVGTLLALVASLIAAAGALAAAPLVDLLAPGFDGATRALTVRLVQILFPGVALLVLSAWCLGVLNSHRRFFLSYASPVLWNAAIIGVALVAGRRLTSAQSFDLAVWLAWGAVLGSALQLAAQLPSVVRLLRGLRPSLAVRDEAVRTTLATFGPVLLGRGSVQLSSYLDQLLASYLGAGLVAAIGYAQVLALLPVSLFGMAVSAAALPEMARASADQDQVAAALREQLRRGLRQVVFLVVPSAVAFLTIGDALVALLFETGRFGARDTTTVWILLAGSAIGLSASTQGRLLASAFYALGAPRPPLHAALVRVTLTFLAGVAAVFPLRAWLGYDARWAAFGLTASAGVAAWLEFALLRRWLATRLGEVPVPGRLGLGALAAAALAGALAAAASWAARGPLGAPRWLAMALAPPLFGAIYLGVMMLAKVPEVAAVRRRLGRRRG